MSAIRSGIFARLAHPPDRIQIGEEISVSRRVLALRAAANFSGRVPPV
jgi:hypothetical protein